MIVKVRELDSFMDRMSNRSCFFNFVKFFKIMLHLPLHAIGRFPNTSTICSSLYFSARISLTDSIGSSAIFLMYTLLFGGASTLHRKQVAIFSHLYFNYSNNFNFNNLITQRNHMIVFNYIPRCNSHW